MDCTYQHNLQKDARMWLDLFIAMAFNQNKAETEQNIFSKKKNWYPTHKIKYVKNHEYALAT